MSVKFVKELDTDIDVPIAIIGGGACGLTAAITAAKCGGEVYLFERDKSPAGSTAMSYGAICGAGTRVQESGGLMDSAEALIEDIMEATRGQTDPDLARIIAQESGPTLDWFVYELGFDLTLEDNWEGFGHRCSRLHGTPNRSGVELMDMLMDAATTAGVTIITQAHVTDIFAEENGAQIKGFTYNSPEGAVTIGCQALILATGGFAANPELVAKYIPYMRDKLIYGCENHMGEALEWGQALGARTADLGGHQSLGSLVVPECFIVPHTVLVDGGVQVNVHGKRFENELTDISGQARRIIKQPEAACWMIYDLKGHEKANRIFVDYRDAAKTNPYKLAPDFESLADMIKVDKAALVETMAGIEALLESGKPDEYGRVFLPQRRLEPPYCAVRVTGALFHTQGGLCVRAGARVLKQDGSAFQNLYAGGGAAQSISGPAEWGYLPGAGLMSAVTLGRLAGRSAAASLARLKQR